MPRNAIYGKGPVCETLIFVKYNKKHRKAPWKWKSLCYAFLNMSQPMSFIVQPSAWVGFLVKFEGQTFNAWQSRILHVHGKAQYENWKGPTAKQMWTNVHKVQGRGIWSVYDVFMPLPCRGPKVSCKFERKSHSGGHKHHTWDLEQIYGQYICLRLRSVSESYIVLCQERKWWANPAWLWDSRGPN